MFAHRWARSLFASAGFDLVVAVVLATFGVADWSRSFGLAAGYLTAFACVVQVVANHHERKTHGRYRKAPKAHRAGTGRGSLHGSVSVTLASGGAVGAGAGMSGGILGPYSFHRSQEEALRRMLAGTLAGTPAVQHQRARPAGEFDGREADFAAGVVTGTRSFDVDKLGRLTGVSFATVWTPGENVARCMQRHDPFTFHTGTDEERLRESGKPPHSIAHCSHGFYGYYEGSNDYYEPGRVMGVVEAYGESVIGSRGFRASKARIVALHVPAEIGYGKRRQIARNYPGVPTFDSFESMVAEFPPDDAGHGLTPDNDPDFWTREA